MYENRNKIVQVSLCIVILCLSLFWNNCSRSYTPRCIVYTKGDLVEISRRVKIEIKREGFEVLYKYADLVDGKIYINGMPIESEYEDAMIRVVE